LQTNLNTQGSASVKCVGSGLSH